ncbi:MAG TPA: cell division protein ZipA [Halomonas sp.]|nr:cell division protein ZipA [Halomonas sp.]
MELREWLIILGLGLVTIIVLDGIRRFQRQRNVPRLDQTGSDSGDSDNSASDDGYDASVGWELPNGGARVLKPAQYDAAPSRPKLERQEHPGPSRVLSEFRQRQRQQGSFQQGPLEDGSAGPAPKPTAGADASASVSPEPPVHDAAANDTPGAPQSDAQRSAASSREGRREPVLELPDDAQAQAVPPAADPEDEQRASEPRTSAGAAQAGSGATPAEQEPHDALHADPEDQPAYDEEDYRLVDLEGMGHSLKSGSRRVGSSVQRFGTSLRRSMSERRRQKRLERQQRQVEKEEKARLSAQQRAARDAERREQEEEAEALRASRSLEKAQSEPRGKREQARRPDSKAEHEAALSASLQAEYEALYGDAAEASSACDDASGQSAGFTDSERAAYGDEAPRHPTLGKALDTAIESEHARAALSEAAEVIIISVMSREEAGFSGPTLLKLMLACGLRYASDMGVFHRLETESPDSSLQFSMVNAVKPGTFPVREMEDFSTPGVTLLMPLPGAEDTAAAFEAMVETAMVIVRHLGGELKDENQSVMTAQTVEFARQRVQEFERRNRLRRYQVN